MLTHRSLAVNSNETRNGRITAVNLIRVCDLNRCVTQLTSQACCIMYLYEFVAESILCLVVYLVRNEASRINRAYVCSNGLLNYTLLSVGDLNSRQARLARCNATRLRIWLLSITRLRLLNMYVRMVLRI